LTQLRFRRLAELNNCSMLVVFYTILFWITMGQIIHRALFFDFTLPVQAIITTLNHAANCLHRGAVISNMFKITLLIACAAF
jgi:hypothetical protein